MLESKKGTLVPQTKKLVTGMGGVTLEREVTGPLRGGTVI